MDNRHRRTWATRSSKTYLNTPVTAIELKRARRAGGIAAAIALVVIGPLWLYAVELLDFAAGGTLGGLGAAATPGDAGWLWPALLAVTLFALAGVTAVFRFSRRRSLRKSKQSTSSR